MDRVPGRAASGVLSSLLTIACGGEASPPLPMAEYSPRPEPVLRLPPEQGQIRDDALARARVWRPPPPVEDVRFDRNPDPPLPSDELVCSHFPLPSRGVTPKVFCVLPGGEVVKVKMGADNAEVFAEVAASRLLAAVGFGADLMYVVGRVRCLGCPPPEGDPAWSLTHWFRRPPTWTSYDGVSVERRMEGVALEVGEQRGWAWHELARVDAARGGATRAELDALRLMAVFLSHWDNKAENQRLTCLPGPAGAEGGCPRPFAYIHDVGATFGPGKVALEAWIATPIWADRATCRVSMKSMPFGGSTFPDAVISEGGRRLLVDQLRRLSREQLRTLFTAARFPDYARNSPAARDMGRWVEAFEAKAGEVAGGPACPEVTEVTQPST